MQKQVFLVADIGLTNDRAYHVGDEAMFICNLERYKTLNFRVVASSRSLTHFSKDFHEVLDITISSPIMFFKYCMFAIFLKLFGINFFPAAFVATIKELLHSNLVHISGGGNMTDFWPGHIYYRCLIIILARLHAKQVIITSQTIGPINNRFNAFVLRICLNMTVFIGVRDQTFSIKQLHKLGIGKPKIAVMPDDATFLDTSNDSLEENSSDQELKVGLSIHAWVTDFKSLARCIERIAHDNVNTHFYLIPHYFDVQGNFDEDCMQKLTLAISNDRLHSAKLSDFFDQNDIIHLPQHIKRLTAQMDVMIASRYHGLVFALSSYVPALALNYDEYYSAKNSGIMDQYIGHDYMLSVQFNEFNEEDFLLKFNYLVRNKQKIRQRLNAKLTSMNEYKLQFYSKLINQFTR